MLMVPEPMQTTGQLHLFGCDEASSLRDFWSAMGASMSPTDQEKCRDIFNVLDVEYLIKTVGAMMNLEANSFEAILLRPPNPRGAWLHTIEYYVGRSFRRLPTHVPASAPLAVHSKRSSQELKPRHPEDEKLGTFLARTGQFSEVKLDISEIYALLEMQERAPGNPMKLSAKQWKLLTTYAYLYSVSKFGKAGGCELFFKYIAKQLQTHFLSNNQVTIAEKLRVKFQNLRSAKSDGEAVRDCSPCLRLPCVERCVLNLPFLEWQGIYNKALSMFTISKENVCAAALKTTLPLPKFHDDGGVDFDAEDDTDEKFKVAPRVLVFKSAGELKPSAPAASLQRPAFDVSALPTTALTAALALPPAEPAAESNWREHGFRLNQDHDQPDLAAEGGAAHTAAPAAAPVAAPVAAPAGAAAPNPRSKSYADKAQVLAHALENATAASAAAAAEPPMPPMMGSGPAPLPQRKRAGAPAAAAQKKQAAKAQRLAPAKQPPAMPPSVRWAQIRRPDDEDLALRKKPEEDSELFDDQFNITHNEWVTIIDETIAKASGMKFYQVVKQQGQKRGWVKAAYVFFKEADAEFDVEKIVRHRMARKKISFEIKWQGFKDTTWEPTENINHLREYRDYCKENGLELVAPAPESSDDDEDDEEEEEEEQDDDDDDGDEDEDSSDDE